MLLFGSRLAAVQICRRDNAMMLVLLEAWLLLYPSLFEPILCQLQTGLFDGVHQPHQQFGNDWFRQTSNMVPAGVSSAGGRRPFVIGLVSTASGGLSLSRKHVSWALFLISFPHSQLASLSFPSSLSSKFEDCLFPFRNEMLVPFPLLQGLASKYPTRRQPSTVVPFPAVKQPFASCISGFMGPLVRVSAADV